MMETDRSPSPYPDRKWQEICALGREVDDRLKRLEVRLTMGGEPTYVTVDTPDDPQWRTEAFGEAKRRLGACLLGRLTSRFAPGALLHWGVGKWYPEEALPRWAYGCYWRRDGRPLWRRSDLLMSGESEGSMERAGAMRFMKHLAKELGVAERFVLSAWTTPDEGRRGKEPAGYVLPLLRAKVKEGPLWASCRWVLPAKKLYLLPGAAPLGLRLPLDTIKEVSDDLLLREYLPHDPEPAAEAMLNSIAPDNSIRVALCAEIRHGVLNLFLPPTDAAENFLDLVSCLERTAEAMRQPLRIEGYPPPPAPELAFFRLAPDPGVLEINTPPASNWPEMVALADGCDEEARRCGLTAVRYQPDGRQTGTGGGHHLTLGAGDPADSPFFRRPDLLRSLITYWQHHPGLSYGFSGLFVGPTGQAPRIDETLPDALYELGLAFDRIIPHRAIDPAALDRLLRYLLADLTGNSHRSEFCLDKLWPEVDRRSRLGLVELRGFEMLPHPRLSLVLALLVRALVARFWENPYTGELKHWGPKLHDRFALPFFLIADLAEVAAEIQADGLSFRADWLTPHLDFRFPEVGRVALDGATLTLRTALEPWPVLGEAVRSGGPSRPVDSSCERLEARLEAPEPERFALLCNGRQVPLAEGGPNLRVGGVRFKLWPLVEALQPDIPPHSPLRFELVERPTMRSLGGCLYYGTSLKGEPYDDLPRSEETARRRREERFSPLPPRPETVEVPALHLHPDTPLTLDLRLPVP
jgi:uncharacterized protein (DUF2126 family)